MKEVRPNHGMFTPCEPIPAEQVKKDLWRDYSYILDMYPKEKELVICYFKQGCKKEILLKVKREDFNDVLNDVEFAGYCVSGIRKIQECIGEIIEFNNNSDLFT